MDQGPTNTRRALVDIYDFAMQMEQDGERFYRTLADSVPDKGLKSIFTTLAEEELKHFRTIQRMKVNTFSMEDSPLLEGIKSIFKVMQANPPKEFLKEEAQEKAYQKARELEEKSWKFYEDCAKKASSEQETALFERLAAEEQRHYKILDNMVELIQRPKTWLEDAEITHLEDY